MSSMRVAHLIGSGTSFPEFVLRLAAEKVCNDVVLELGGPLGLQIPQEKEVVRYRNKITKLQARLKRVKGMTVSQQLRWATKEAKKTFDAEQAVYRKTLAENTQAAKKHETMRAQIEAWESPTPDHYVFKEIMLKEINDNICELQNPPLYVPKRKTAREFLKEELERLEFEIPYFIEQDVKEADRVRGQNDWVDALTQSLIALKKRKPRARKAAASEALQA